MIEQHRVKVESAGRSTIEVTDKVRRLVDQSCIVKGLCHIFVRHTSASLIITENADRNVRIDLENYIARLVPDGDPAYHHNQEGDDDMAAHIRSVLTQCEITVPIWEGALSLGSWQGLFLWEHRTQAHVRELLITLSGDNN